MRDDAAGPDHRCATERVQVTLLWWPRSGDLDGPDCGERAIRCRPWRRAAAINSPISTAKPHGLDSNPLQGATRTSAFAYRGLFFMAGRSRLHCGLVVSHEAGSLQGCARRGAPVECLPRVNS